MTHHFQNITAKEFLAAIRPEHISYQFLAAICYTRLFGVDEIVSFASTLTFDRDVADVDISRLAHSLADEYSEREIELNQIGRVAVGVDGPTRRALTALWVAKHLDSKAEMRLGFVSADINDDFCEIRGNDDDWAFPMQIADLDANWFGKKRKTRKEFIQFRQLFNWLFYDELIVDRLLIKLNRLSHSWAPMRGSSSLHT